MAERLAIHGGTPAVSQAVRNRLPSWPIVSAETAEGLKQLYLSGQWSFNGNWERAFCAQFAAHHSATHGVMMVNGTVTLECALRALGVGPGDEVIVPALTWMATAMAALYVGATPVFVDIEPDTLCLDPAKTEKALTAKTKAIIPVHLYGSMADMDAILDLAGRKGLAVVEDCAHAHGGVWAGRGVGSLGQIGSFSFQQSKTLTSGEGGICITRDAELARKLQMLKHIGYDPVTKQGQAASGPPPGLVCRNYRATEFQAFILLDGLKRLAAQTEKRDANAAVLRERLADHPAVKIQSRGRRADLQGYYCIVPLVDLAKFNNVTLDRLREIAAAEGLPLARTYGPVYKHILWNIPPSDYRLADGGCPVCEEACDRRATALGHGVLLGEVEMMEAIARTFQKLWALRKELA